MKIAGKSWVFWAAVAGLWSGAALSQAAAAQDAPVRDSGSIGDFRLDQPAGPTDPERPNTTTPRAQPTPTQAQPQPRAQPRPQPTQPQVETPRSTATPTRTQPTPVRAAPTPTQRTIEVDDDPQVRDAVPAAEAPIVAPDPATPAQPSSEAPLDTLDPKIFGEAAEPVDPPAAAPTIDPAATTPQTGPDWGVIAPYALGGIALLLALFWFTRRKRPALAMKEVAPFEPAATPKVEPKREPTRAPIASPAASQPAAQKSRPSGTVGIPIAKAPPPVPATTPQPSLAERGFITTRAHQPEMPAPTPRPSGTIGIPLSRVTAPAPEPVVQLTDGTHLIAGLLAEELIRDDDELRLRFALTIANLGTMEARNVALRTVLLTAAPDSDRVVAGWLANPTGDAATTIETIDSGTQTQVNGEIRLFADQIRAMRHGGEAVFVPMLAIALDYLGADGLDRAGDAFIIGQTGPKAANGIAAPVLPLPHEGALPRRWTDLAQRPAGLGTLAKA